MQANLGIRTDVGNLKPFNIYPVLKVVTNMFRKVSLYFGRAFEFSFSYFRGRCFIGEHLFERWSKYNHLGVIVDNKLNWENQISAEASKKSPEWLEFCIRHGKTWIEIVDTQWVFFLTAFKLLCVRACVCVCVCEDKIWKQSKNTIQYIY